MRVETSLASKGENPPSNERFKRKSNLVIQTIESEKQTAKSTLTIEDIGTQLVKAKPTSITNKAITKQALEVDLADIDTKDYIVDLKKGNSNILVTKSSISKSLGCCESQTAKQTRESETSRQFSTSFRREDSYSQR